MGARLHRALLRLFGVLPRRVRRVIVRRLAPSFTVGAVCVIERSDGRMLLIHQSYRKRWGLPGGLLQRKETPAAAAVREVKEEVDLDVEVTSEPVVVVDERARRVDVVFRAKPVAGADPDTAQPSSPEIVQARWFDPAALPEVQYETTQILQALARASFSPPARPVSQRPTLGGGRAGTGGAAW